MPDHRGFVYVADPGMAHTYEERVGADLPFTDAIANDDHRAGERALALLSFDTETVTCAALVTKVGRAVTGKVRVQFSDYVRLTPIQITALTRAGPPNLRRQAMSAFSIGGQSVPPATWQRIWELVKSMRPEARHDLERLERKVRQVRRYDSVADQNARLEVDAVALALSIFGIQHNRLLQAWEPHESAAAFLSGRQQVNLPEDFMIVHDASLFPGWESLGRDARGVVTFERDSERLQVMNVHRTPLERVLGVDLLYFHHAFGSYVFVQYKRMSGPTNDTDRPFFRPSGPQYEAELARMHTADLATFWNGPVIQCEDYRLWSHAFFLKLCSPSLEKTPPEQLVAGMYFPLDYWDTLVASPFVVGRRGGTIVGYENAQRWLNNGLFIRLVQNGWVGSRSISSQLLRTVAEQSLESGHALTVALSAGARSLDSVARI